MNKEETTDRIARFKADKWPCQTTFHTPLEDLPRFVSTAVSALGPLEKAVLAIDEVVFEPKTLKAFLSKYGINDEPLDGSEYQASGQTEAEGLLVAALSDWLDFLYLPYPERLAVYADHDEFITSYTNNRQELNYLNDVVKSAGYEKRNYKRKL